MTKKELAIANHDKKYNCCQAVVCAFSEEAGVPPELLFKAGEAFGLGMGGMECTCGALTAAVMLAGFQNSDGNTAAPATKAETYKLSREMTARFREKTGAIVCKDLKGIDSGKVLCSCPDCIRMGVEVVEEVLGF